MCENTLATYVLADRTELESWFVSEDITPRSQWSAQSEHSAEASLRTLRGITLDPTKSFFIQYVKPDTDGVFFLGAKLTIVAKGIGLSSFADLGGATSAARADIPNEASGNKNVECVELVIKTDGFNDSNNKAFSGAIGIVLTRDSTRPLGWKVYEIYIYGRPKDGVVITPPL